MKRILIKYIMDIKDITKIIKTWLEPKGFVQTSNKRLFVKDKGFYLIVASVHPHKAYDGFCFDLAVKFLWSTSEDISYDYTVGDSSVYGQEDPQPTLGAILYNGAKLEDELAYLMQEADRRIDVYESLSDYQAFLNRLQNRRDFVSIVNRDFDKRDKAKAVALVLCGRASEAQEIFVDNSPYDSVSERFANSCLNYEDFERELLDVVNNLRRRLSTKMKIKLEDIEKV